MPTLEFFGMEIEEQQRLESYLIEQLEQDDFKTECVFVRTSTSRVLTFQQQSRPFVRLSTRSPERAERFREILRSVCDLEVVHIDFHPQSTSTPVDATNSTFEQRLVENLQPIRHFALAQAIYHLFSTGLHSRIKAGAIQAVDLAHEFAFDPPRTLGFLHYLANENIVDLQAGTVSLTKRGEQLEQFRPWFELLVGGYSETFQQIETVLAGTGYASRNAQMVGVGSCGISAYDALPLVQKLLAAIPDTPTKIIDLGCGDGTFLAGLIDNYPSTIGLGVDLTVPDTSLGNCTFVRSTAIDYLQSTNDSDESELPSTILLAAFLLQEILEQDGRQAVVQLVRTALQRGGHLAVVEVDHRPTDALIMKDGLGLSYYNPYYLLHQLTEQRLETRQFWLDLFADAEATVVAQLTADEQVDSTGLELGFLLTHSGSVR